MTSEEIKKAMLSFSPVKYKGITYKRISAYIYRVVETSKPNEYKTILQVELLDRGGNSVTVVEADKIELAEVL